MADHQISFTEYPHGKIRSIIADGTHWVTVSESGINAGVAAKQARREMLLVLKGEVEELHEWPAFQADGSLDPFDAVLRSAVLELINNRLKEN
jgi:hypothetical protein